MSEEKAPGEKKAPGANVAATEKLLKDLLKALETRGGDVLDVIKQQMETEGKRPPTDSEKLEARQSKLEEDVEMIVKLRARHTMMRDAIETSAAVVDDRVRRELVTSSRSEKDGTPEPGEFAGLAANYRMAITDLFVEKAHSFLEDRAKKYAVFGVAAYSFAAVLLAIGTSIAVVRMWGSWGHLPPLPVPVVQVIGTVKSEAPGQVKAPAPGVDAQSANPDEASPAHPDSTHSPTLVLDHAAEWIGMDRNDRNDRDFVYRLRLHRADVRAADAGRQGLPGPAGAAVLEAACAQAGATVRAPSRR